MKNLRTVSQIVMVAAVAALVLAGCLVPLDPGAGSVGIQLPDPRSETGTDPAPYARIYVINGNTLLDVGDGTAFAEVDLDPEDESEVTEVSVGPVPAGDGYRVVLVFGDYDEATDVFVPVQYALSAQLKVYAGQATETEVLEVGVTPFVNVDEATLLGLDLKGIVWDFGTTLYTATSTSLYRATTASPSSYDDPATDFQTVGDLQSGITVNSITLGAVDGFGAAPWLNTTEGDGGGIVPYTNAFLYDYDVNAGIVSPVLDSGAYVLGTEVYGYYQTDGGLGGVWDYVNGGTIAEADWLQEVDLKDFVTGVPVYDLAVYENGANVFGYFATKLGAFRISDLLLEDATPDYTADDVFRYDDDLISEDTDTTFFELFINNAEADITEIAVDAANSRLYLGSPRGAAWIGIGDLGGDDPVEGNLIDQSVGLAIQDIAVGDPYVAILATHFLIVSADGGDNFDWIPLYASAVGDVTGMLLDTANGIVLLSGSTGLVGIDITGL